MFLEIIQTSHKAESDAFRTTSAKCHSNVLMKVVLVQALSNSHLQRSFCWEDMWEKLLRHHCWAHFQIWRILLCCLGINDKRQVILWWLDAFDYKISNARYKEISGKTEKPGKPKMEQMNAFVESRGWLVPPRILRSKGCKAKLAGSNQTHGNSFTTCLRRLWNSLTWDAVDVNF